MGLRDRVAVGWLGLAISVGGSLLVPFVGLVVLRYVLSPDPAFDQVATTPVAVVAPPEQPPPLLVPTLSATVPATPTPTSTPTPTPTPTPPPHGVVNATAGLNVRTEPGTRSRVLEILPHRTEVELSGRERTADGLLWLELAKGGWVQARFVDRVPR
ncbi:MAG: SH3 domain-containing protein [Actinobacteria bacterium]|nr:SH3 domain-containing protein [Actinomycetota bacterium]